MKQHKIGQKVIILGKTYGWDLSQHLGCSYPYHKIGDVTTIKCYYEGIDAYFLKGGNGFFHYEDLKPFNEISII